MFDQVETYSGNLVHSGAAPLTDDDHGATPSRPQTADEILEAARAEAAELIEAAQQEADVIKQSILTDAKAASEALIIENTISGVSHLKLDLWSSKTAMVEIVKQAVQSVIGPSNNNAALLAAVEHATHQYSEDHILNLRVSRKTADRLNLIAMGSGRSVQDRGINIQIDESIADDRCVLDTGRGKVEVGLQSQLDAFKKAFEDEARSAASLAEQQIKRHGKLS